MIASLHAAVRLMLGALGAVFFFFGMRFLLRRLKRILLVKKISTPLTILLIYFAFLIFQFFYPLPLSPRLALYLKTFFTFLGIYIVILFTEILLVDYLVPLRRRIPPPSLLREIVRWVLAIIVAFVLLRVMLNLDLSPIFFTSAAVTLVIGLALRDLLSNLFSGITLNMERPFRTGDWVMAGSQIGEVVNTTWRATRIKTLDGDFVIIPNATISTEQIINYHAPSKLHARHLMVGVSYEASPNKVKDVMAKAALETDGVLKKHSPVVWLKDFGDFSITYELKFWIDNYRLYNEIEDEVRTRIWYSFKRNGIRIPFPIRNIYMRSVSAEDEKALRERQIGESIAVMSSIEILKPLNREELWELSSKAKTCYYGRGETLVRQGESGDSFFIIKEGEAEVSVVDERGKESVVAHLTREGFFGEGSLLTGEERSATVIAVEDTEVVVIEKSNFADILTRKPEICTSLSRILQSRLKELAEKRAVLEEIPEEEIEVESSSVILKKIRNFFGL
jgi:small-conductance mechanosensitive channel/CRP-like cAMP-binding protein